MTEAEARAVYRQGEDAVVAVLVNFGRRLQELEVKLGMNSTNSSKPPSTDNKLTKNKSKTTSTSKNKRGAQVGHKGSNLKISATPDITNILLPFECSCCHASLKDARSSKIEKRQVFDLPDIKIQITEYQAHTKECPKCNALNKPLFPNTLNATVQYGDNLKSFISYCNTYQMLPYERIAEMIEDLTSHKMGKGTIYNFLSTHHEKLEIFENEIKPILLKEDVLHSDETGINVNAKLNWIHVSSSKNATFYMLHEKRGQEAFKAMDILPHYKGVLVHDHWRAYNNYECKHSFCNAHILRELSGITQLSGVIWSKDMHTLLTNMNITVHKAKNSEKTVLSEPQVDKFTKHYEKIIHSALRYYPPPETAIEKTRGRPKQDKGKNLLDRLTTYQEEHLRFLNDFRVPFTNNLAERDLRMVKVKEKISGTFVSFKGGEMFCRIRSYISTLKKNNIAVLQGLRDALEGRAYVPLGVGC